MMYAAWGSVISLLVAGMLAADDAAPLPLFNGSNLLGWEFVARAAKDDPKMWSVEDGVIVCHGHGGGWISTTKEYADFELSLDYKLTDGANSGVFIRSPREGRPSSVGIEIQIIDEHSARYNDPKHPKYYDLKAYQRTGAVYGVQPPARTVTKPASHWNSMTIRCQGRQVAVTINGVTVVDCNLDDYGDKLKEHPGLLRKSGYIGLSSHNDRIEFRNIFIKQL